MRANKGRVAAARALIAVERGDHVEAALDAYAPPKGSDRGLAWYLALGVLRHRGQVDAALRGPLKKPLNSLDIEVRTALRIGAFERLFARTPPHAVVHQGVELVSALRMGRAKGMVNAVLRRVAPAEKLSRSDALGHPGWLLSRWDARYGTESVDEWCARSNEPAPVYAVCAGDLDALVAAFTQAEVEAIRPVVVNEVALDRVLRVDAGSGAVTGLPGFSSGKFWVQDASAVAVADLAQAREGSRILDACAAPGGKTFRLISQGATVIAVDRDKERLQALRTSAKRLRMKPTVVHHNWSAGPLSTLEPVDVALVDAPCTGLGTLRRHPEIRWRRIEDDITTSAERARVIAQAVATHVKPGGALIYAVCSPEPEEGRGVVEALLADLPGWTLEEELETAPPAGDYDAHFAARLRAP